MNQRKGTHSCHKWVDATSPKYYDNHIETAPRYITRDMHFEMLGMQKQRLENSHTIHARMHESVLATAQR